MYYVTILELNYNYCSTSRTTIIKLLNAAFPNIVINLLDIEPTNHVDESCIVEFVYAEPCDLSALIKKISFITAVNIVASYCSESAITKII